MSMKRIFPFLALVLALSTLAGCALTASGAAATAEADAIDCGLPAIESAAAQLLPEVTQAFEQGGATQDQKLATLEQQAEQTAVGTGTQAALCAENKVAQALLPTSGGSGSAAVASVSIGQVAAQRAKAYLAGKNVKFKPLS